MSSPTYKLRCPVSLFCSGEALHFIAYSPHSLWSHVPKIKERWLRCVRPTSPTECGIMTRGVVGAWRARTYAYDDDRVTAAKHTRNNLMAVDRAKDHGAAASISSGDLFLNVHDQGRNSERQKPPCSPDLRPTLVKILPCQTLFEHHQSRSILGLFPFTCILGTIVNANKNAVSRAPAVLAQCSSPFKH